MNVVTRMQLKNGVERILRAPGNYVEAAGRTGSILEMALVFDYQVPEQELRERAAELVDLLKTHSEIFRNVRLNVIKWINEGHILKELSSLPQVRMGRVFDDYGMCVTDSGQEAVREKSFAELARQLKLFYARSKLIIVVTDGGFGAGDAELLKESMSPFLHKKLLFWQQDQVYTGTAWMFGNAGPQNGG